MRIPKYIPNELKRLINAIVKPLGLYLVWLQNDLRTAFLQLRPHRL